MNRSVLLYAAALVASLLWAYMTWTHEGEVDPDGTVVILDGKPDDLVSIVYDAETVDVTISMKEDALGRYGWAEVTPKVDDGDAEESAEPAEEPDPHAPPKPDTSPAAFKIGQSGDTMIGALAPFTAKRQLEGVPDDQLGDLGLSPPEATLTITRQGREPKTYEVGGNAFGGVNLYIRDPSDDKLYVVDAKLISPLQAAKRTLLDRALFEGAQKDIKRVVVRQDSRESGFVHKNPDDPQARGWTDEGQDTLNPTAGAWIDKVLTLSAAEYIAQADEPGDLAEAFSVTIEGAGSKPPVTIHVLRGQDEAGEASFYARSEHTRGLVELHRSLAAEAVADIDSALSGEAAAADPSEAAPEDGAP